MSVTNWGQIGNSPMRRIERGRLLAIPMWFPLSICLILPIMWLCRRLTNRRRLAANFCAACGYDLRASKDKCPECGAGIESKPTG